MNKKKIIISVIVCVILIAGITTTILLLNNKKEEPKETLLLNDNLNVEINSEVKLLSFVSKDNKVKILSDDVIIDTSTLGEKDITIKYLDKDKEEEFTFKIKVIDTQAPTIEYKKELSTQEGTEIDLLKDVKVEDNSKEELEIKIEGEYDFNKVGTYNLKYVTEDSSKNKTEEEFTLTITEKPKQVIKEQPKQNNNQSIQNSNNNLSEPSVSTWEKCAKLFGNGTYGTYYKNRSEAQSYVDNILNNYPECNFRDLSYNPRVSEAALTFIAGQIHLVFEVEKLNGFDHSASHSARVVENPNLIEAAHKYYESFNTSENYFKVFYLYHVSI